MNLNAVVQITTEALKVHETTCNRAFTLTTSVRVGWLHFGKMQETNHRQALIAG